jgi:hypothetical protein
MAVDINGTVLTGGTSLTVTDGNANRLYQQTSNGNTLLPANSSGTTIIPMFNVGMNAGGWTVVSGTVAFTYTSGSGYFNVGGCYSTSTYRFTAPYTGLYLFKQHIYTYGNNSTIAWYYHPMFTVNGSFSTRRAGTSAPYKMRQYGRPASWGEDSDCCELIYLVAADYVSVHIANSGTIEGFGPYSSFSGAYLGD